MDSSPSMHQGHHWPVRVPSTVSEGGCMRTVCVPGVDLRLVLLFGGCTNF